MKHQHFIINKPPGFLSQFIYEGKRKSRKKLLGELYDFPDGTMAIGRLDESSEGLLFLTTDGKMSHFVRSAKVEKQYLVLVDGIIDQSAINEIKDGVLIGINGSKYKTKPCDAHLVENSLDYNVENRIIRDERHGPTSWASITLREGKFRQVRKMTAAVGYPTLRLIRVRIGKTILDLEPGESKRVESFLL